MFAVTQKGWGVPLFSANLGFLWNDRPLPDAIHAAARAGFDAVECHFPYEESAEAVKAALEETGLPMLGLNTVRGDAENGDFGLCALPDRVAEARQSIDQAIDYAGRIGARAVHVMAGKAEGEEARAAFLSNLDYASARAADAGLTILIEPINRADVPAYFLNRLAQAADIITDLGRPNVKLMFDCYHCQMSEGNVIARFEAHLPHIGHVQFASVPGRGEPDQGELAYDRIFSAMDALGYDGYAGAEYRPRATVEEGLGWLKSARAGSRHLI